MAAKKKFPSELIKRFHPMQTKVKTDKEIRAMREAGKMLSAVLDHLIENVEPGRTTQEMANLAHKKLKKLGGQPSFLGYQGFPSVVCTSLNDEIVHGIPKDVEIMDGDLVSFDFGVTIDGMITDSARTVIAGQSDPIKERLLAGTKESLMAGIKAIKGETRVVDISKAIQEVLDRYGFGIVRDLVGHGVGHNLHEEPNIPNYAPSAGQEVLLPGMTVAIEPMATLGGWQIKTDSDQWTIRTQDGSLSAHFEHTVLVTDSGFEILTG